MSTQGSKLAVIAAFLANLAIAIAKLVVAAITGSAAMFSEGVHSIADTGNQGLLLYGMRAAARPANTAHPFGRGKESYFWAFMVAVMLFAGGAVLAVRHGIDAIRAGHELSNLVPNLVVLTVAVVIESFSFTVALRQFNHIRGSRRLWRSLTESKDASLVVVLLEDSAALAGLVVALTGIGLVALTGNSVFDGSASVVIGVILGGVALLLARETKALLIGEAASRSERAAIRGRLLSMPEVEAVGSVLTMQMGPNDVLVNVEVDLADHLTVAEAQEVITRAEHMVQGVIPGARNVSIEMHGRLRG
jgi:cation diffusion facilitator family transporter